VKTSPRIVSVKGAANTHLGYSNYGMVTAQDEGNAYLRCGEALQKTEELVLI
jgi:hypothetical protein